MKKKLLCVVAILCAIALIATVFGPGIILNMVRQPQVAESYAYSDSFLNDYDSVRSHLQVLSSNLGAEIYSHAVDAEDGVPARPGYSLPPYRRCCR